MHFKNFLFIITVSFLLAVSCTKHEKGTVTLHFTHTIDDVPVKFNQLIYTNTVGNKYQVNEIKYFISKLILINEKKELITITQDDGIHYVDCSLEDNLHWSIFQIPDGNYTSISFIFGLDESDNTSNRFVNPPENNFSWPNNLGGGYHYMQINGKFLNREDTLQNLNIHTGIGQLYDENNEITEFVHNHFTITLPIKFSVYAAHTTSLTLNMEIQRWFDTPNLYNFDDFGTGIMQNQLAQKLLKQNGENVFDLMIR